MKKVLSYTVFLPGSYEFIVCIVGAGPGNIPGSLWHVNESLMTLIVIIEMSYLESLVK